MGSYEVWVSQSNRAAFLDQLRPRLRNAQTILCLYGKVRSIWDWQLRLGARYAKPRLHGWSMIRYYGHCRRCPTILSQYTPSFPTFFSYESSCTGRSSLDDSCRHVLLQVRLAQEAGYTSVDGAKLHCGSHTCKSLQRCATSSQATSCLSRTDYCHKNLGARAGKPLFSFYLTFL